MLQRHVLGDGLHLVEEVLAFLEEEQLPLAGGRLAFRLPSGIGRRHRCFGQQVADATLRLHHRCLDALCLDHRAAVDRQLDRQFQRIANR